MWSKLGKETDRQGQEITAASSSLLASIKEQKEKMEVTVENLNREIGKSKENVDSKSTTISGESGSYAGNDKLCRQYQS